MSRVDRYGVTIDPIPVTVENVLAVTVLMEGGGIKPRWCELVFDHADDTVTKGYVESKIFRIKHFDIPVDKMSWGKRKMKITLSEPGTFIGLKDGKPSVVKYKD